jgi:hypothetical protein
MVPKFVLPVCLLSMIAVGMKADSIRRDVNPVIRDQNLDVSETNASASLLGQFRTSMSAWLWLRVDLYLHNGTEMRPLLESERRKGVTVEDAADDGNEKLHEENEVTAVPPKERDFRGVFGDIEREVASYRDMHHHKHNEPQQALPLFRLMTWLDPQFIQGWTTGAMVMARTRNHYGTDQAIAFLKEGWAANPDDLALPGAIGYTIASRHGNLKDAIGYLDAARQLGIKRVDQLSELELNDLLSTYRWLGWCYRDSGDVRHAKEVALEGLQLFPDDGPLTRLSQQK